MASLQRAAQIILNRCMAVKKGEKVLVICDANKKDIGELLFNEASKITSTEILEIPVGKISGEEPSEETAVRMLDYDVILIATTKSLSHTNARKNATNAGARIASMPGITKEILENAIDVDYGKMKLLGTKLKEAMAGKTNVTLITQKGTMLTFSIKGRTAEGGQAGLCVNAGDWDNLPAGEAYVAPLEGTANGVVIIDASIAGIGKLDKPVRVVVEKGFAVKIEGAEEAEILRNLLAKCGSLAFNIAEFGIGTNPKAKVTGIILEDEKAIGTCHIAFGSNFSFGGTVNAGVHLDGVIFNPTVFVDNKKIIDNGKFLI